MFWYATTRGLPHATQRGRSLLDCVSVPFFVIVHSPPAPGSSAILSPPLDGTVPAPAPNAPAVSACTSGKYRLSPASACRNRYTVSSCALLFRRLVDPRVQLRLKPLHLPRYQPVITVDFVDRHRCQFLAPFHVPTNRAVHGQVIEQFPDRLFPIRFDEPQTRLLRRFRLARFDRRRQVIRI